MSVTRTETGTAVAVGETLEATEGTGMKIKMTLRLTDAYDNEIIDLFADVDEAELRAIEQKRSDERVTHRTKVSEGSPTAPADFMSFSPCLIQVIEIVG